MDLFLVMLNIEHTKPKNKPNRQVQTLECTYIGLMFPFISGIHIICVILYVSPKKKDIFSCSFPRRLEVRISYRTVLELVDSDITVNVDKHESLSTGIYG